MKGIILAGGTATRLKPVTNILNKHLLPIYNKPLIYYPLSTLMLLGIKDILITSQENDLPFFQDLLKDGSQLGIKISYEVQKNAGGIAEVLLVAENFVKNGERFAMILGDNIFYISNIKTIFQNLINSEGAGIVLSSVHDPHRFGIAEFDNQEKIISIEEKPANPKSNWAITGLYFYDQMAIDFAKKTSRSARGELEISSINAEYLKLNKISYLKLMRGSCWLDAGTPNSMFEASQFIKIMEERQSFKIGAIEEIAYNMNYINKKEFTTLIKKLPKNNEYTQYLANL